MDVTKIPFNKFMGIIESGKEGYLLALDHRPEYMNHVNTMHAGAQFALAEATSGKFLLDKFSEFYDNILPVVRRAEVKYSKPGESRLYSRADIKNIDDVRNQLRLKNRLIIIVDVDVFDENGNLTMKSSFEWFIQKLTK